MNRKGRRISRTVGPLIIAYAIAHLFSPWNLNQMTTKQTRMERKFKDHYGITVKTNNPDSLNTAFYNALYQTLQRENFIGKTGIKKIIQEDSTLHDKPLFYMLKSLIHKHGGQYLPLLKEVSIVEMKKKGLQETIHEYNTITHHEFKHDRLLSALIENKNLKDDWISISQRTNRGYMPLDEQIEFMLNTGIYSSEDSITEKERLDNKVQLFEDGFVENYARFNIHEDHAKLCEYIENEYSINDATDLFSMYFSDTIDHGKIEQKINLAQEIGSVDNSFSDYFKLKKEFLDIYFQGKTNFKEFLENSEIFLEENPHSMYTQEVKKGRLAIYYVLKNNQDKDFARNIVDDPNTAIETETQAILTAENPFYETFFPVLNTAAAEAKDPQTEKFYCDMINKLDEDIFNFPEVVKKVQSYIRKQ